MPAMGRAIYVVVKSEYDRKVITVPLLLYKSKIRLDTSKGRAVSVVVLPGYKTNV